MANNDTIVSNGEVVSQKDLDNLVVRLKDREWRLFGGQLYKITTKKDGLVPFKPNVHQKYFFDNMHSKNIILKARQLGFTTLIDLMLLDLALWNPYTNVGITANKRIAANDIYDNKIRVALDNLPDTIKSFIPVGTDKAGEVRFKHNESSVKVDTTFRGRTLQALHISEFGSKCAKDPAGATEIITGSLPAVADGNTIIIESTAEGASGYFYDMCMEAMEKMESGQPLTDLDYKFFFFPWFTEESYKLESPFMSISQQTKKYFEKLSKDPYVLKYHPGIVFSDAQMFWYQETAKRQKSHMAREYPSTPKEAFEVPVEGAFYDQEFNDIRSTNRICEVKYNPDHFVNTAWDLGNGNDDTVVWFYQYDGHQVRVIDYFESNNMSMDDIVNNVLLKKPYKYDQHYIPHDAGQRQGYYGRTREFEMRQKLGGVVRLEYLSVADGINQVRGILPMCVFDDEKCHKGITHLANYRREFDDRAGMYKENPLHNVDSHASDAFRYLAVGFRKDNPQISVEYQNYGVSSMVEEMYDPVQRGVSVYWGKRNDSNVISYSMDDMFGAETSGMDMFGVWNGQPFWSIF